MPLSARTPDGERVTIFDVLQGKVDADTFLCPFCQEEMHVVRAVKRTPHFRHYPHRSCGFSGESARHLMLKSKVGAWLLTRGWDVDFEAKVGDGIADVLARKEGFTLRVEVQCSGIDLYTVSERILQVKKVCNKGGTLWFFDYVRRKRFKRLEEMFVSIFGDIYYLDYNEDYTYPLVHTSNESHPLSGLVPVKVKSGVVLLGESRTGGKPVRIEGGVICPHCLNVSNFRELVEWDFTTNNPKPVDVKAMCEVCGGVVEVVE